MFAMRNLIQNRHGTYNAQRKIPKHLQEAVARIEGKGKSRKTFLKKSLGTKVLREANVRAKFVLAEFDRTLASAAALIAAANTPPLPLRTSLNQAEIARMAETLYGKLLSDDEAWRFGGRAYIAQSVEWIRRNDEPDFVLRHPLESVPEFGWGAEQLERQKQNLVHELATMREALAQGDIRAVQDDVSLLLDEFQINLDRQSASYRELCTQALQAYVRASQAIEQRNAGLPVETPKFTRGAARTVAATGTLRDAFEGWEKERTRPTGTVHEYRRAVEMFVQHHGNMVVAEIMRSHVREFRQALQLVPRIRKGSLRNASLPELCAWHHKHPDAPKVSPGTVNKQLGAVQAITAWANNNGLVPDDAGWSDPFHNMRVEEEQSERTSFEPGDLQTIFNSPLFRTHKRPHGAKGEAGVWLPLLALFTGARQAELASLKASNVLRDAATNTPLLFFIAERKSGKRLKTKSSERAVQLSRTEPLACQAPIRPKAQEIELSF
jgi:integrase